MKEAIKDFRINDRNFTVKILQDERYKTVVNNQPRIIQICWTVENNKRVTGERFYPLEWLSKTGEVKKEIKERITEITRDFSRVYKYVTNTNVETVKELNAADDEDLLEIICLYESPLVAVPFINKGAKRSLLKLENNQAKVKTEINKFDIEFEVNKELYSIRDNDENLDTYIILLGYNPQLFKSREEKFLFLVKKDKNEIYELLKDSYETKVHKATANLLLQIGAIKKINNMYMYNETLIGYSYNDLVAWLRDSKNAQIVKYLTSLIPKERMNLTRDMFDNTAGKLKETTIEEIENKELL